MSTASGTHSVRCVTCYRVECWTLGGDRDVVVEGGARRPAVHAQLAAWRTLRRSLSGELGPVVAVCPGCDQPMVAEPGARLGLVEWTIPLPEGPLLVGDGVRSSAGRIGIDDAHSRIERAYRRRWNLRPGRWLFQGLLLGSMGVPLALWLLALLAAGTFVLHFWRI